MLWIRLFLPFAGAYFLSYHFRTANAVVGPVLAEEFALGAADLGLLTSTYFLVFGAIQLPLGMLLDRFGARRVEAFLLLFAAAGAAVFASADGVAGLALGRGLIGFGVSACLMASFKSFSQWFPLERQASLTGWIMTSGTLGALVASAPLDAVLQIASWREVFYGLSVITAGVALWLFGQSWNSAIVLGLGLGAGLARVTRSAMQEVAQSPAFEFARTKGLTDMQAMLRHGLRAAAVPVVAYLGVQTLFLVEGALVVETVFAWPGIGHALVHAIFGRDIPIVQGAALAMALMFVLFNLLLDAACVALDPRQQRKVAA